MQPVANFLRLQDRHRLVKRLRLEIQEQRHGDGLQIANSIRRFHRRTGQHACAPGLLAQFFREGRRELFQLVDIGRVAKERESKLPGLFKVAIVNF